jgi:hypothetical protein
MATRQQKLIVPHTVLSTLEALNRDVKERQDKKTTDRLVALIDQKIKEKAAKERKLVKKARERISAENALIRKAIEAQKKVDDQRFAAFVEQLKQKDANEGENNNRHEPSSDRHHPACNTVKYTNPVPRENPVTTDVLTGKPLAQYYIAVYEISSGKWTSLGISGKDNLVFGVSPDSNTWRRMVPMGVRLNGQH